MRESLNAHFRAVARWWWLIVTGGILGAVGLAQGILSASGHWIPWFFVGSMVCVVIAQFLAFDDLRQKTAMVALPTSAQLAGVKAKVATLQPEYEAAIQARDDGDPDRAHLSALADHEIQTANALVSNLLRENAPDLLEGWLRPALGAGPIVTREHARRMFKALDDQIDGLITELRARGD